MRGAAKVKGKVYKTVMSRAMLYALEILAPLKKNEVMQFYLVEIRFSLGVTKINKIRND